MREIAARHPGPADPGRLRRRHRPHPARARLDQRLDHRRGPPQAAAAGIAPPNAGRPAASRPRPADPHRTRRRRSAARAAARPTPADRRVQRDRVQGPAPLQRLPRAVRRRQGDLIVRPRQAPSPSRTDFHPLIVARVDPLTDDSAAITFDVPGPPGRRLRLRARPVPDRPPRRRAALLLDLRRPGRAPRIGVREVAGGAVSGWLVREVRARRHPRGPGAERHLHPRPVRPRPPRADRRGLRHHAR